MGIQGLLPLLKSIQLPISMAELSGNTVGVDVYCWLHKGAYACALHLAEGKDTDVYVNYVMRRVNMMMYHKVKPILVFDGGYLPSKKETETERRNKRKENRSLGMSYLQSGDRTRALDHFQKSIDITPEMAYKVVKVCREKGVDCIVAPYEADAQLAYLMKAGITQFTISEDSDLLVYGCEKVVFKMDANGSGLLVNLKNLPKLSVLRMDGFTEEKFRQMCILSGCDYLQSVKGMGLITSHRLLKKHSTVKKAIGTLRLNCKMKVPPDYETRFVQAEQTFLYQIVFDPNTGRLVPLNPVPESINTNELHFAGHHGKWKQEEAFQLALGNINPITGNRMGNIRVDKIISFDKQEEISCEKKREKTTTTPLCSQKKPPRSLLSSNGKYEAQKNLNGSFRETKSSEKTNSPFVTPTRTKRSRSVSEENLSEAVGCKLVQLYLALDNEEAARVRQRNLEAECARQDDERSECTNNQPQTTQLKKRFKNPFRCPEKVVNKEQIVSRYFGSAGMDSVNKDSSVLNENDSTPPGKKNCSPQTTSSSPRMEDSFTSSEHTTEIEFQDSGYCSQTMNAECSPPGSSSNPESVHKTTPVLAEIKPASRLTRITSRDRENREPLKKKSKPSQTSLERFTFVKSSAPNSETKHSVSPASCGKHRTTAILGSNFSENSGEVNEMESNGKGEELKNENFTKSFETNLVGGPKIASSEVFGEHKWKDDIAQKTKTTIGLRSKPSTGLGRCRSVGLRRPKADKKKTTLTSPMGIPLLSYFTYPGRSSQEST